MARQLEDIDGLASGPLCETLTEPQRNAIRWIGLWDELSDFPQPEETQAVQSHRRRSNRSCSAT